MWIKKITTQLLSWIFPEWKASAESEEETEMDELDIVREGEKLEEEIQKFKVDNVIFDKLNYLEQYIKIFSLTFPREYKKYLQVIRDHRQAYEKELEKYQNGLSGSITFSIDPEQESARYVEVVRLEDAIKRFVEMEVNYKLHKEKFSKMCSKLNIFYNALFNTNMETQVIVNQLNNASETLGKIIGDVKTQEFFEKDSRKREEILNYIIYCEYIIFKSYLRCSIINSFSEYKQELSAHHILFVNEEYDRLVFKFLLGDLEQLQIFIVDKLGINDMYEYILKSCQDLQSRLDDYSEELDDYEYFQRLIKFENTINDITKAGNIKFSLELPSALAPEKENEEFVSVKSIACAILKLLRSDKAKLLAEIISDFKIEISWREFFFLCKIFEIYEELVEVSANTIFSMIKDKFLKIEAKYKEYTNSYIQQKKEKVLNYNGSKSKKYVLLVKDTEQNIDKITAILDKLSLDFVVDNDEVYLNHTYFNGFKNLEQNFGAYKIF